MLLLHPAARPLPVPAGSAGDLQPLQQPLRGCSHIGGCRAGWVAVGGRATSALLTGAGLLQRITPARYVPCKVSPPSAPTFQIRLQAAQHEPSIQLVSQQRHRRHVARRRQRSKADIPHLLRRIQQAACRLPPPRCSRRMQPTGQAAHWRPRRRPRSAPGTAHAALPTAVQGLGRAAGGGCHQSRQSCLPGPPSRNRRGRRPQAGPG